MRIAFIGQKGIPAVFGGVEYHVESVGRELAGRGHEVLVYVRSWYTPQTRREHQGMQLIHLPTIRTKHLDAAVHSFLASVHALLTGADIIHYQAIGPAAFSLLPRLFGRKTVATVHRLDWQSGKWKRPARFLLRIAERLSVTVPARTAVVSAELQDYFRRTCGRETTLILPGKTEADSRPPRLIRDKYGLKGRDYILFMGRLTPEKRVDWLIRAFRSLRFSLPEASFLRLVVAGGSSATRDHVHRLKEMAPAGSGILFTGNVTGEEKAELLTNALFFVLPSSLEGFPIVLLEARSHGLCCLASDIPPHREALHDGRDGILFQADSLPDLESKMKDLVLRPDRARELGLAARRESDRLPGWDEVARRHEELYRAILHGPRPG